MSAHLVVYLILAVIAAFVLPTYIRVRTSAAYKQLPNEVVTREPGRRLLGKPYDALQEALADLPFALLSQAAYQRKPDAEKVAAGDCVDADEILEQMGWTLWQGFPDADLESEISKVHLRVEVWSNPLQNALAVAFGGTVFSNRTDWNANLRWLIPHHEDEYTAVVKIFGSAFITEYLHRNEATGFSLSQRPQIFSAGHSLGGGLAQQFAYSLPLTDSVPRVTKVYAFDPSPVTGFYSVNKHLRTEDKRGLLIDRIYERGEVLAYLRSITSFFHKPSQRNAEIRQVRYNLYETWNPISGHSIAELACKLYGLCSSTSQQRDPIAS